MLISYDNLKPRFADVSHYRVIQNEEAFVAASTAELVAFKVCEDANVDGTLRKNVDIASRNNLVQVGYEYDNDGSADKFLWLFPPADKRIPCIDCEAGNLTLNEAEKWIKQVQAAYGTYPWVYGRDWFVAQGAVRIYDSIVGQCPYWGSQYGVKLYVPAGIKLKNVVAWQFTDGQHGPFRGMTSFPGVGPCDINLLLQQPISYSPQQSNDAPSPESVANSEETPASQS